MLIFSQFKTYLTALVFYIIGKNNCNSYNISTHNTNPLVQQNLFNETLNHNKSINEINHLHNLVCSKILRQLHLHIYEFEDIMVENINTSEENPNMKNKRFFKVVLSENNGFCLDGKLKKFKRGKKSKDHYFNMNQKIVLTYIKEPIHDTFNMKQKWQFKITDEKHLFLSEEKKFCFFFDLVINYFEGNSYKNEKNQNFINKAKNGQYKHIKCTENDDSRKFPKFFDFLAYLSNDINNFSEIANCKFTTEKKKYFKEYNIKVYIEMYKKFISFKKSGIDYIEKFYSFNVLYKNYIEKIDLKTLFNKVEEKYNPIEFTKKLRHFMTKLNFVNITEKINSLLSESFKYNLIANDDLRNILILEFEMKNVCKENEIFLNKITITQNNKEDIESLNVISNNVKKSQDMSNKREMYVIKYNEDINHIFFIWKFLNENENKNLFFSVFEEYQEMNMLLSSETSKLDRVIEMLKKI